MVYKGTSVEDPDKQKYTTESLHKINISCDQIRFNPLNETVTITSCKLKHNGHTNENNNLRNCLKTTTNHNPNNNKKVEYTSYNWYIHEDIVDWICLGVIVLLILVWLSVFIYYEIFYEFESTEWREIENNHDNGLHGIYDERI